MSQRRGQYVTQRVISGMSPNSTSRSAVARAFYFKVSLLLPILKRKSRNDTSVVVEEEDTTVLGEDNTQLEAQRAPTVFPGSFRFMTAAGQADQDVKDPQVPCVHDMSSQSSLSEPATGTVYIPNERISSEVDTSVGSYTPSGPSVLSEVNDTPPVAVGPQVTDTPGMGFTSGSERKITQSCVLDWLHLCNGGKHLEKSGLYVPPLPCSTAMSCAQPPTPSSTSVVRPSPPLENDDREELAFFAQLKGQWERVRAENGRRPALPTEWFMRPHDHNHDFPSTQLSPYLSYTYGRPLHPIEEDQEAIANDVIRPQTHPPSAQEVLTAPLDIQSKLCCRSSSADTVKSEIVLEEILSQHLRRFVVDSSEEMVLCTRLALNGWEGCERTDDGGVKGGPRISKGMVTDPTTITQAHLDAPLNLMLMKEDDVTGRVVTLSAFVHPSVVIQAVFRHSNSGYHHPPESSLACSLS
ncbi:hypothetical protein CERSUDRAFT_127642 [Gelatoporia subvermispora B]|uniref:Uncharacterized protein n=1 Tax=Ceriporiopsis subvermispora (strain B) TaxID=914234 RepID=M2P6T2_CERS8|nr:hypothetical protein CERSUDRAFT_127642 [Gelatoporia subvermispora B]